ncbi:MAG: endonuclease domain-containing protein [Candidatus Margulisiibacteriota bacterium]
MTKLYNRSLDRLKRKILRKNMTEAERVLWQAIRKKNLNCRFRRQYSVKGFVLDFYSPQVKLAIEVDGGIHSSEERKDYDADRERLIGSLGINFLRFSNDDVLLRLNKVIKLIKEKILLSPPYQGGDVRRRRTEGVVSVHE